MYTSGLFILNGIAAFDWSRANITNNVDGSLGNTDGHGYAFNGTVGQAFPLFNTTGVNPAIPTKAPPSPRYGGYAVFLDVSGNLGYRKEDRITDSPELDRVRLWDGTATPTPILGANAKLVAVIPTSGFMPGCPTSA